VNVFSTKLGLFSLMRAYPRLAVVQLLVLLLVGLPALFSTMSFVAAETPEQAVAHGTPLPEGWTAGVMNHGTWYRWWTIQENPALFGASVFLLVAGMFFLYSSLIWSWRDYRKHQLCGQPALRAAAPKGEVL
jgi:hypothetical protein